MAVILFEDKTRLKAFRLKAAGWSRAIVRHRRGPLRDSGNERPSNAAGRRLGLGRDRSHGDGSDCLEASVDSFCLKRLASFARNLLSRWFHVRRVAAQVVGRPAAQAAALPPSMLPLPSLTFPRKRSE